MIDMMGKEGMVDDATVDTEPGGSQGITPVCDCFPEHCLEGDTCWCEPRIEYVEGGGRIIIHNEGH